MFTISLCRGKLTEIKRAPDLDFQEKYVSPPAIVLDLKFCHASCFFSKPFNLVVYFRMNHWLKASPWLTGINPRDAKMPKDGDDGFFPTTGNDLVSSVFSFFFSLYLNLFGPYMLPFYVIQKPEVVTASRKYRVRVLVCAPSNSALDEIVLRLLSTGIAEIYANILCLHILGRSFDIVWLIWLCLYLTGLRD